MNPSLALQASGDTAAWESYEPVEPPRYGEIETPCGKTVQAKIYGKMAGNLAVLNYILDGEVITGAVHAWESVRFDS